MSGTAGTDDEISYLALQNGTPVLSSSATEFGTVHHVLVVESLDLFDGIVVKVHHGLCFVDRDQIAKITRTAVHCQLSDAEVAALPPPSNPPVEVAEIRSRARALPCTPALVACSAASTGSSATGRSYLLSDHSMPVVHWWARGSISNKTGPARVGDLTKRPF